MSTVTFTETRGEDTFEITQTIKEVDILELVAPAVAERRKWLKYGLEKGYGPGVRKETTDVEENNVELKLFPKTAQPEKSQQKDEPTKKQGVMSSINCRTCGGAHLTHTCPYKDRMATPSLVEPEQPAERTDGKYVPPGGVRSKLGMGGVPGRPNDDDGKTLRVSNLPEDINEHSLKQVFARVGMLQRCHVARDKITGKCRGFAFASYSSKDEAEKAMRALDGKTLGHLVIKVEIAKKNN